MSTPMMAAREALGELPNPLGLQGVEFIEYATSRPQALGQALERMGFQPVARHRSREVLLYRQGEMNIIVNAHQDEANTGTGASPALTQAPVLTAIAFRVANAAAAYRRVLELKCVEEESNREIARRLGLKESTVATRVLRGRTMLAAALEKEGYVHG